MTFASITSNKVILLSVFSKDENNVHLVDLYEQFSSELHVDTTDSVRDALTFLEYGSFTSEYNARSSSGQFIITLNTPPTLVLSVSSYTKMIKVSMARKLNFELNIKLIFTSSNAS